MFVIAKDGTSITQAGCTIHTSAGEFFTLGGRILSGPNGIVSWDCPNESAALGIILGLHGGPRY